MSNSAGSASPFRTLWQRVWPIYGVSLLGLWPLADVIRQHVAHLDPVMTYSSVPMTLVAAGLAQTAVLLLIFTFAGAALAHRLGLSSVLAERSGFSRLIEHLPLAMGYGGMLGLTLAILDALLFLPQQSVLIAGLGQYAANPEKALVLGLLYGGITEEVMMRWGLMSLICWSTLRLTRIPLSAMPGWVAWIGILVSALVFALGHLPFAMLLQNLDLMLVCRIFVLNSLAGALFGWLFWRYSLESAFVAHGFVHVAFYVIA